LAAHSAARLGPHR